MSACGSAIDNGAQIATVYIDFLGEHIHLDGVLTRSRNEDGIIQNLENVDSDRFGLDEMLVLGERTAIFGSAHFAGLHFDGDNAVDEDLCVGVRFLFGHVFVIDTATCGLNQALEHIFQKGLGNFRFGTNAVNGRRVIGSENLLDYFDSHNFILLSFISFRDLICRGFSQFHHSYRWMARKIHSSQCLGHHRFCREAHSRLSTRCATLRFL